MDKKIDLDKLIEEYRSNGDHYADQDFNEQGIKFMLLDFGKQLLELAHENAWIEIDTCMGQKTGDLWVNKESVLDTIKQVV